MRNPNVRMAADAVRRAAVAATTADEATGTMSSGSGTAGTNDAGTGAWVPYGRLGINALGDFRLSNRTDS